jgi:hypothetical protein
MCSRPRRLSCPDAIRAAPRGAWPIKRPLSRGEQPGDDSEDIETKIALGPDDFDRALPTAAIGILSFALLTGYFVIQNSYLERPYW